MNHWLSYLLHCVPFGSLTISECFSVRVVERAIVMQNRFLLPTIQRSWIQHVTVITANNTVLISNMRCTGWTWMIREELAKKAIKVPKDLLPVQHCWWEEFFRARRFSEKKFSPSKVPGFLPPHEFIIISVNWTLCRLHSVCLIRKRKWKQKSFQHKDQQEILLFVRSTAAISVMLCWLFSCLLTHCIWVRPLFQAKMIAGCAVYLGRISHLTKFKEKVFNYDTRRKKVWTVN